MFCLHFGYVDHTVIVQIFSFYTHALKQMSDYHTLLIPRFKKLFNHSLPFFQGFRTSTLCVYVGNQSYCTGIGTYISTCYVNA